MAKRTIDLGLVNQQNLSTSPQLVLGGKFAKRQHAARVCAEQDQLTTPGRRILAAVGLQGSPEFSVANGTDPDGGSQIYPETGFERTRLVTVTTMTPGSRLRVEGLALPSGPNSATIGLGSWFEEGRTGSVQISVNFDNGVNNYTRAIDISVPSSLEEFGAEPVAFANGCTASAEPQRT